MGWLRRLVQRFDRSTSEGRAARFEAAGRLDDAYAAYVEAGRHEDAARILLARAEAEPDPIQRKALLNLVLARAPESSAIAVDARRRRALLSFELLRALPGPALPSESRAVGADLEAASLFREAAQAFALANDHEGQARMLAACGAIDALEQTFEAQSRDAARRREREQTWKSVRDLDAIGRRRDALAACRQWLESSPRDEDFASFAVTIERRMVRPGALRAQLAGQDVTIVVDEEVVVGRSDASIAIPSPALSRRHLIVKSSPLGPVVADAGSRNGTTLAGARVDGPIPIGAGLDLLLGGQVPLHVEPWAGGGAMLSLSGQLFVAPFGPLLAGPFVVDRASNVMVLRAGPSGAAPVLNGLTCDAVVDLCWGDEIRESRDGPIAFKVVAP